MSLRKYSKEERSFIEKEIIRLLENDIIEESISPWRSQCLVVKQKEKQEKQEANLPIAFGYPIKDFILLLG